jgi:hypothetical protein
VRNKASNRCFLPLEAAAAIYVSVSTPDVVVTKSSGPPRPRVVGPEWVNVLACTNRA